MMINAARGRQNEPFLACGRVGGRPPPTASGRAGRPPFVPPEPDPDAVGGPSRGAFILVRLLASIGLIAMATMSLASAAERKASAQAREFIENLNQACDHQARIPASVRVIGNVAKPGWYEMRTTDSVWTLLERAKMDADAAALDQIVLIRREEDGSEGRDVLNWAKREEYGVEPLLCDGDVVYVPVSIIE